MRFLLYGFAGSCCPVILNFHCQAGLLLREQTVCSPYPRKNMSRNKRWKHQSLENFRMLIFSNFGCFRDDLWCGCGWACSIKKALFRLVVLLYPNQNKLVGGVNPSEKYESQLGWLFSIYGKIIQSCSSHHQPDIIPVLSTIKHY